MLAPLVAATAFARKGYYTGGDCQNAPLMIAFLKDQATLVLALDEGFTEAEREAGAKAICYINSILNQIEFRGCRLSVGTKETLLSIPIYVRQPNSEYRERSATLDLTVCRTGHSGEHPTPIQLVLTSLKRYGGACASVQLRPYAGPIPDDDQGILVRSQDFLSALRTELSQSTNWQKQGAEVLPPIPLIFSC